MRCLCGKSDEMVNEGGIVSVVETVAQPDRSCNEVHFYAALLKDMCVATAVAYFHLDERLDWLHLDAGLMTD